ncbi:MAG: perilipin family protein [Sphaerochaeta sp.]|jgi:hypothetical protein|nr:perilipin family protein [Sphaerochaeta sp.]
MKLRQTIEHPINGYGDGEKKQVFDWGVEGSPLTDSKGQYVRVGSLSANHYFHVALGKTDKLTLRNAKLHLKAATRLPSTFEYIADSENA